MEEGCNDSAVKSAAREEDRFKQRDWLIKFYLKEHTVSCLIRNERETENE